MSPSLHCHPETALERVNILLGCYRRGEAENPDIYVAAVAAVLSRFPEEVVRKVTDPVRGLPAKSKWLPSVAEVRAACDEEMSPVYRQQERERRAGDSFNRLEAPTVSPEDRARIVEQHWEQGARPTMAAKVEARPKETPEDTLARLSAPDSPIKAPVVVGSELAAKLFAMKQERGPAA